MFAGGVGSSGFNGKGQFRFKFWSCGGMAGGFWVWMRLVGWHFYVAPPGVLSSGRRNCLVCGTAWLLLRCWSLDFSRRDLVSSLVCPLVTQLSDRIFFSKYFFFNIYFFKCPINIAR